MVACYHKTVRPLHNHNRSNPRIVNLLELVDVSVFATLDDVASESALHLQPILRQQIGDFVGLDLTDSSSCLSMRASIDAADAVQRSIGEYRIPEIIAVV